MLIFTKEFGSAKSFRSSIKKGRYYIAPHIHQHLEMIIALEGEISIEVDGVKYSLKSGDACVIAPLRLHTVCGQGDFKMWMSVFSAPCIPDWQLDGDLLSKRQNPIFTPERELLDYARATLPIEEGSPVVYFDDIPKSIRSALYALLTDYCDKIPESCATGERSALYRAVLYIGEHFREKISLSSVGKALGYNPKYLSQCFSTLPNMSFNSLLNSCRIELAKTMLIGTELKVIEIAYECGYSEERTFRRVFTSLVGHSPSEYRIRRKKHG